MDIKLILSGIITDEKGQGIVEYAFVLSLIAMVVIGSLFLFGGALRNQYETFTSKF